MFRWESLRGSRRIQAIALAVVLAAAIAIGTVGLSGCGGGGGAGGSAVTIAPASGRVVLPPGFSAPTAGLTVQSGFDTQPLSPTMTFRVGMLGQGPGLVMLTDAAGKVLLLGFADAGASGSPAAGGNGEISAQQTATALLFYAVSAYTLPASSWQQARLLIAQSPQAAQLTAVISTRVAASPTALADGDKQIVTAAQQAAAALVPPLRSLRSVASLRSLANTSPLRSTRASGRAAGNVVSRFTVTRAAGDPPNLILVQPGREQVQSGVEVLNNPAGEGIVLVNHFRRRAAAFIYETGTADSDGKKTILPTPKPLTATTASLLATIISGAAPSTVFDVQPSNALDGTLGSLVDLGNGIGAFTPVSSKPIDLPADGSAAKTFYEIVVVGPAFAQHNSVTAGPIDPALQSFAPLWQKAVNVLSEEELILDVVVPIFGSFVYPDATEGQIESTFESEDALALLSEVPDITVALANGDVSGALHQITQDLADAGPFQTALAEFLVKAATKKLDKDLEQAAVKRIVAATRVVAITDLFLNGINSASVIGDSISALPVETWQATVGHPTVRLTPQTTAVSVDQTTVLLTTTPGIPGDPKAPFVYHYLVTGSANGGIEDSTHVSGLDKEFDTVDAAITYAMSGAAVLGQSDTVTVQAFANAGDFKHPVRGGLVGQAQSVVTVQQFASNCGALPAPIVGNFGDVTSPGVVHPGDTITVTVTLFNKKPAANTFRLFLQDFVKVNGGFTDPASTPLEGHVTAITLDGQPQDVSVPISVGIPNGNAPNEQHVVTFTLDNGAPVGQCPSFVTSSSIHTQGPWIFLQDSSSGTFRPFVIQGK